MLVSFTFSLAYRLVLGAAPIKLFPAASHLLYLIPIRNLFRLCLGDPVIHFACPLQTLYFRCSSLPFCNLELSLISWAHMNSDFYFSVPPVPHLSLAVTPIVLFILLLNKSVSFQKAVFWLTLHNNKPLETWLFTHVPDIILMDFGTHRQSTGRLFSKRFFLWNWCGDIKISEKAF